MTAAQWLRELDEHGYEAVEVQPGEIVFTGDLADITMRLLSGTGNVSLHQNDGSTWHDGWCVTMAGHLDAVTAALDVLHDERMRKIAEAAREENRP